MRKVETEMRITPDLLCKAYSVGVFPMARSRDSSELLWIEPRVRGILPLDKFCLSRRDERALRKANFITTLDRDFSAVVRGCAERLREKDAQSETWINAEIEQLYGELHRQGYAHSIEVYSYARPLANGLGVTKEATKEVDTEPAKETAKESAKESAKEISQEVGRELHLVGGLYGVALGAAFFGESMFSNQSNASKAALRYLVERLRACNYQLLDVQFKTPHLGRFGVLEVSQQKYLQYLVLALQKNCRLR